MEFSSLFSCADRLPLQIDRFPAIFHKALPHNKAILLQKVQRRQIVGINKGTHALQTKPLGHHWQKELHCPTADALSPSLLGKEA